MIAALRRAHPDLHGEWLFYEEAFRIDALAIAAWPSRDFERIAFEVKVSRSDFKAEMRNPEKRANAIAFTHRFFFAVPEGLVEATEVPGDTGLIWVHEDGSLQVKKRAPRREPRPFTDAETVYLARFALYREGIEEMAQELGRLRFQLRGVERDKYLGEGSHGRVEYAGRQSRVLGREPVEFAGSADLP